MTDASGAEGDTFEIVILSLEDFVPSPTIIPSVPQTIKTIWENMRKWAVHKKYQTYSANL